MAWAQISGCARRSHQRVSIQHHHQRRFRQRGNWSSARRRCGRHGRPGRMKISVSARPVCAMARPLSPRFRASAAAAVPADHHLSVWRRWSRPPRRRPPCADLAPSWHASRCALDRLGLTGKVPPTWKVTGEADARRAGEGGVRPRRNAARRWGRDRAGPLGEDGPGSRSDPGVDRPAGDIGR